MRDHNNPDAVHQWDLMQHEKSAILLAGLYRLKSDLFFLCYIVQYIDFF